MASPQSLGFQIQALSSPVKSVQRGTFGGAGSVTITAVATTKTVVLSASKGAAGQVSIAGCTFQIFGGGASVHGNAVSSTDDKTFAGGTTNLWTKHYSAVLTNATTLTADGACEYQVIEYT